MINGNIEGIKEHILNQLDELYDTKIEKGKLITDEIIDFIVKLSFKINREINIAIDRNGNIIEISVGDSSSVSLPPITVYEKRLSGIRILHTHPGGNPHLSSVDISALLKLKLDCIVSIGINDEGVTGYEVAFCKVLEDKLEYEKYFLNDILNFEYLDKVKEIESELKKRNLIEDDTEYAILVGIDNEESLDELKELARACELKIVGTFFQKRRKVDPLFLIGSGKIRELALEIQIKRGNLLIFDEELSGLQLKCIEEATGCKVIDRTTLILEIFAKRARTREAKLQVELAQLKYRSNRLIGFGITMSRLGGGVGTKGPGEKKLEIDRRIIKKNIAFLKEELEGIKKIRNIQREKREESGIARVSLVGYTNVGKSTLRNILVELYPSDKALKKEEVLSKDMLFATLDTTTRTLSLKDKRIISMTDTVGFIKKLPHDLVESFKSTLEEVIFSDLIVHIADISANDIVEQIDSVEKVLEELSCLDKTKILILNKIDLAREKYSFLNLEMIIDNLKEKYPNYKILTTSAREKENLEEFMNLLKELLVNNTYNCKLLIPYSNTEISAMLHRNAVIKSEEYTDKGIEIEAMLNEKEYNICKNYVKK